LLLADTPPPDLLNRAAQVVEATAVQQTLRAFPLAVGLRTASLLGYILATVISLASFAAHLVFIVSQRRSQFAVLRAIGLDTGQLYGLLLIEQLVLVFSGLLLGTGLGILLAWLTLHNLNFDWGGLAAAPPFVVVWDWAALVRTYALFAVTVVLALLTAVFIIRRMGLQQALSIAVE
jgi:ABC-type lipoprotein release transport system permease subunit